jgi:hypothetical protein
MPWYQCTVNRVGPAAYASETAQPVIYINLTDTDTDAAFEDQWYYAAENSRHEILATALAAIAGGKNVQVAADPPNPGGAPYTEASRLYIIN